MRGKTKDKILGYAIIIVSIETVCVLASVFGNQKYGFLLSMALANGFITLVLAITYAAMLAVKLINR